MHGTEDDSVLDGPQQFFVGFQKRGETVEISRGHLEGLRIRSISPAPDTVAGFAMALIHGFPAHGIGRILLRLDKRMESQPHQSREDDDLDDGRHQVTMDRAHENLLAAFGKSMTVRPTLKCPLAVDHKK